LPPSINLEVPDEQCDLDYVTNGNGKRSVEHILSNSFGFGGVNAALVMRR
jgi:3-oxoacyl-[acyl-carrier-protein] synthase II